MADDDDDLLPDGEAERAHARRFAELVDQALAGRTPPAMSTDDRALLEVATVIRAADHELVLAATTRRAIVEDALGQAIGSTASTPTSPPMAARRRRWVPWAIAGTTSVIAAAALALWLRAPAASRPPANWMSRPADLLIGPIARERAGDASARLDHIFADRMDGYRERRLARGGKR
jgi:hypothetical protein